MFVAVSLSRWKHGHTALSVIQILHLVRLLSNPNSDESRLMAELAVQQWQAEPNRS